jgi:hypothetical protein
MDSRAAAELPGITTRESLAIKNLADASTRSRFAGCEGKSGGQQVSH